MTASGRQKARLDPFPNDPFPKRGYIGGAAIAANRNLCCRLIEMFMSGQSKPCDPANRNLTHCIKEDLGWKPRYAQLV